MRFRSLKRVKAKLGQNTAEYLIMLVLIAVGSIGFVSLFGKTIKKQFKNSMAAIEGDSAGLHQGGSISSEKDAEASDMAIDENDFVQPTE